VAGVEKEKKSSFPNLVAVATGANVGLVSVHQLKTMTGKLVNGLSQVQSPFACKDELVDNVQPSGLVANQIHSERFFTDWIEKADHYNIDKSV
jgi:hypothetical protein